MVKLTRTLVLAALSSVSPALAQCGWPEEMLSAPATSQDGTYSCGARVNWLRTVMHLDESSACSKVDAEFPQGPCGPYPYLHCGCPACTSEVWTRPATDDAGTYSCGSRIEWLQSSRGYSEANACERVTSEFPGVCTCNCVADPGTSRPTTALPTRSPTRSPTRNPTALPTSLPPTRPPTTRNPTTKPTTESPQVYCGCNSCTSAVLSTVTTDFSGSYSCQSRIEWLQGPEGGSYSEADSCIKVGGEFPAIDQCGPCNPNTCNQISDFLDEPDPSLLVFSDEFDQDGTPDETKWNYDLGDGCEFGICNWGNGEVAYYTDGPSNVRVENGSLLIAAKKDDVGQRGDMPFTAARIVTRGKHSWRYGRVQFRVNLAYCQAVGTWPALWMLPEDNVYGGWPRSGEIDVMEAVGHELDRFFGTVHTEAYNGMTGTQKGSNVAADKDGWHVFEIDWSETTIKFAVDGRIYFRYSRGEGSTAVWPFDQKFHIIMNIAVGGAWGGAQGIDEAAFNGDGQIMLIDWVRVYTNEPQAPSRMLTQAPIAPNKGCGCDECTQAVLDSIAGGYSCNDRIEWVMSEYQFTEQDACRIVGEEYPSVCGPCHSDYCGSFPPAPAPAPTESTLKVMSYNTEYTGYFDGRMENFAAHIRSVNADIAGLQECQDSFGIAQATGYALAFEGNGNTILYKKDRLKLLRHGVFDVPRDNYAQRNIAYAHFQITQGRRSGTQFWYFNTHLPHRHNQAADPNTHAIIANMLLNKRIELGAGDSPTIVTGDCNPFASDGASRGSFESNLKDGGIDLVYVGTGAAGGFGYLDKIFASNQWSWSNGRDEGTGSSDHPAISAEFSLK